MIFLDCVNTIFYSPETTKDIMVKILKNKGVSEEKITNAFQHIMDGKKYPFNKNYQSTWERELYEYKNFSNKILQFLSIKDKELEQELLFMSLQFHTRKLYEEGFEAIKELSKLDKIVILSNAHQSTNWLLDFFDIKKYCYDVVLSCDLPFKKPDKRIYEYVLKKYQINPKECYFVDDKLENVLSANELGIQSYLINRKSQPFSYDKQIYNLKDLIEIIKNKDITNLHCTKKGWYGFTNIKNKNYFVKKTPDFNQEVKGYKLLKDIYKLAKLKKIDKNKQLIYSEILPDFDSKTLHNSLLEENTKNYAEILNTFKRALQYKKVQNEKKSPNYKFFGNRSNFVDEFLKNNQTIINKKVYINGTATDSIFNIFNEIKKALVCPKNLSCFLSQGDPIDINMSYDGTFIDLETAGYNSIVGEMAIFLNDLLINANYFFIKYSNSAYKNFKQSLSEENFFLEHQENDKQIDFKLFFKIPKNNKELILQYIQCFEENLTEKELVEVNRYFKYYFSFRMIAPKKMDLFQQNDKILALAILVDFWTNIQSLADLKRYILNH